MNTLDRNQNTASDRNALNEGLSRISQRINTINQNVNNVFENSNTVSRNIDRVIQDMSSVPSLNIDESFFRTDNSPQTTNRINNSRPQTSAGQRQRDLQRSNRFPQTNNLVRSTSRSRNNINQTSRNTPNRRSENNINSVQNDAFFNGNLEENNFLFETPRRSRMLDLIRSSQRVRPASFNNRFFQRI